MAEEFNEETTIAYFGQLIELDMAGERAPLEIGPWMAMSLIILIQLSLRHPEVPRNVKNGALNILGELEKLFKGTYGEKVIAAGYDTSQDVTSG